MRNINADLYYLPRVKKIDIAFAKIFGKRKCVISSVEIQTVYDNPNYKRFFNEYIYDYFCISNFLKECNDKYWDISKPVLYLGIVPNKIKQMRRKEIKKIVFVGSVEERKRPLAFVEIAKHFPCIKFEMIGDGSLLQCVKDKVSKYELKNFTCLGKIDNKDVTERLSTSDLLLMLSTKEGLPKVVLEAASVGVPSIYINKFYSIDYIRDTENGYLAKDDEDVVSKIQYLIENKSEYERMSSEVFKLRDIY